MERMVATTQVRIEMKNVSKIIMVTYLRHLAKHKTWPLQSDMINNGSYASGKYHIDKLVARSVLTRTSNGRTIHITPGPAFIAECYGHNLWGEWQYKRAGARIIEYVSRNSDRETVTVEGRITSVDLEEGTASVIWLGKPSKEGVLSKKSLRPVWPPKVGACIYKTILRAKYGVISCEDK